MQRRVACGWGIARTWKQKDVKIKTRTFVNKCLFVVKEWSGFVGELRLCRMEVERIVGPMQ
jgi:hypothetical protein